MNISLPVNIKSLLSKRVVESDRIEFKSGWNPKDVMHTMCAFANDIHNWGGGYIIIGIDAEEGQAILPPKGVEPSQIDKIQGELLNLSNIISPNYFPIVSIENLQRKHIVVIWCPAGDYRPYRSPESLAKDNKERYYYVRKNARTIKARETDLKILFELTARVPYDDRINDQARIDDLDLGLIREYLKDIKSDLFDDSVKVPFDQLCRQLNIAKGPTEAIRPTNAGLLFFCNNPHKFHERARIEIVVNKNYEGRNFIERIFKGPIHHQLSDALRFIKAEIIKENVIKVKGKAKALRYYNFPFDAVEEILTNAVYHKSYQINNPIEVQIFPDRMNVLSFPGPIPPVDIKSLNNQKRIISREYRNRRIGDLLKELNFTEGRGTGLPMVYNECEKNGSPKPYFETDENNTYFLSCLFTPDYEKDKELMIIAPQERVKIQKSVVIDKTSKEKFILSGQQEKILRLLVKRPELTRNEIAKKLNLSESTVQRNLDQLKDEGYIIRHGSYKGYWEVVN